MSNSNGRRARSLDDIAGAFRMSDRRDARLSEASFARPPCRQLPLTGKKIESSESANEVDDCAGQVPLEKSNLAESKLDDASGMNLTANPVDAAHFADPVREEDEDARPSSDDWKEKLKSNKRLLSWIDAAFSLLLVTPMTVGFWRGIWTLMDLYLQWFPQVLTFIFGTLTHTIFAIFKNRLHDRACANRASRKKSRLCKTLLKCLQISYTYVFGAACNAQWRGGWYIFDYYFGTRVWAIVGALVTMLTSLTILRSVRNVMAVPTVVLVDKLGFVFLFPTRYESVLSIGEALPSTLCRTNYHYRGSASTSK